MYSLYSFLLLHMFVKLVFLVTSSLCPCNCSLYSYIARSTHLYHSLDTKSTPTKCLVCMSSACYILIILTMLVLSPHATPSDGHLFHLNFIENQPTSCQWGSILHIYICYLQIYNLLAKNLYRNSTNIYSIICFILFRLFQVYF